MSNIGPPLYVIKTIKSKNIQNKIDNTKKSIIDNNNVDLPIFTMQNINELEDFFQSEIMNLYTELTHTEHYSIDKADIERLDYLISVEHNEIMRRLTDATYYYNNFNKINKRLELYHRYIITYIVDYNDNLDEIQVIFAPRYGGKKPIKHKHKHKRKRKHTKKTCKNKSSMKKHKRKSYKK